MCFSSTWLLLHTGCTTPSAATPGNDQLPLTPATELATEQPSTSQALAWYSEGLLLDQQGDTEAALAAYQQAMELDPTNESLYMETTSRLIQADRVEDAFLVLEQILNRNPANVQALRWKARLFRQEQDMAQALTLYQQTIALKPVDDVMYLEAIQLALQEEQRDLAISFARTGAEVANSERIFLIFFQMLEAEKANALDLKTIADLNDEAQQTLDKAREHFPEHAPFHYLQAERFIEANNMPEAFEVYELLDDLSEDPDADRTRMLVHALEQLGGGRRAANALRTAVTEQELGSLSWYFNGLLWEIQENPRRSKAAYEKAFELNPEDTPTLRKLAVARYQEGNSAEALALLDEVLDVEPDHPEMLLLSGQIALASGFSSRAAEYLQRRLDLVNRGIDLEEPLRVHGQLAIALWDINAPLQEVEDQLVLAGKEPGFLEVAWRQRVRTIFLEQEENPERAEEMEVALLEMFENISDRLPLNPEPFWLIASSHRMQKDYSSVLEALEGYKELAEDTPQPDLWLNTEYYFDRAAALERTGQREKSIQTFLNIIEDEPNHHPSLNYVAYMWAEEGENLVQALDFVQQAMQLDPNNGSYIDTLGWIYFMQGRFEEAYKQLMLSAELIPDESVVAEHLGDVLMKLDRPVEARGYYRIALELDPAERLDMVRGSLDLSEEAVSELLVERGPEGP